MGRVSTRKGAWDRYREHNVFCLFLYFSEIMKANCCVPGCGTSHRNKPPDVQFYCLPKDPKLRKIYDIRLKNDNLKTNSSNTRICSRHWEGGKKLSRTHLPLFPWTNTSTKRREIYRKPIEESATGSKQNRNKIVDATGQNTSTLLIEPSFEEASTSVESNVEEPQIKEISV